MIRLGTVMRVIKVLGGQFRGRTLQSVPGDATRPPLSRVREAVANIVSEYIPGARVLDMFSGTGSFAIELLSRGASFVTCIDKNPKAITVIRKNLQTLGVGDLANVVCGDTLRVMQRLPRSAPYRIVLVAPPYMTGLDLEAMSALGNSGLVDPFGIAVLQQHHKESRQERFGDLFLHRTYTYGQTRISTYRIELPRASDSGKTVRAVTE